MEEYIRLLMPSVDVRPFAIMPTGEAFVMRAGLENRETAFAVWLKSWKKWGEDGIRQLRRKQLLWTQRLSYLMKKLNTKVDLLR